MSSSIKFITKIFILIVYIITILLILYHHYVEVGECATRVHYYPLGRWDYILIPLVGIIMLFLSMYITPASKVLKAIGITIYASLIIATLRWGNFLLSYIFRNLIQPISLNNKKL